VLGSANKKERREICGLKCELRGHQPVKSARTRSLAAPPSNTGAHVAALCHDHYDVAVQILFAIRTGGRALLYLTTAFFAMPGAIFCTSAIILHHDSHCYTLCCNNVVSEHWPLNVHQYGDCRNVFDTGLRKYD
jgi:hypothetical protein